MTYIAKVEPQLAKASEGKGDEPIRLAYVRFHDTVSAKRPGGGGDQVYGDYHFSMNKREGASIGDRGGWDIFLYLGKGYVTIHHPERKDVLPVIVPIANVVYGAPYDARPKES
jgi:hypothetical protein